MVMPRLYGVSGERAKAGGNRGISTWSRFVDSSSLVALLEVLYAQHSVTMTHALIYVMRTYKMLRWSFFDRDELP